MLEITKRFTFEAAHRLPWHKGKCQQSYGYSYKLEVSALGELNENDIVLDFDDLTKLVKEVVIDRYDHKDLNDFFPNPSAEVLAQNFLIDLDLAFKIKGFNGVISKIRLWETENCSVLVKNQRYESKSE
ncbi:MAG: 6-carboxytetrahydropterin synthase [Candidatus Paceibacterota bacterium]|jgi:6-pyruvoyltetrahydropterin/6-carboxytetrahydropterin synthase